MGKLQRPVCLSSHMSPHLDAPRSLQMRRSERNEGTGRGVLCGARPAWSHPTRPEPWSPLCQETMDARPWAAAASCLTGPHLPISHPKMPLPEATASDNKRWHLGPCSLFSWLHISYSLPHLWGHC